MRKNKFFELFLMIFFLVIGFQIQSIASEQGNTNNIDHFFYSHKTLSYFTEGTFIRGDFYSTKEIHIIYTTVKTYANDSETNPLKSSYEAYVLNAFDSWDSISSYIVNISNWDTITIPAQMCDVGEINNLNVHYTDNSTNNIQTNWGSDSCSTTRTNAVDNNVKIAMDFYYNFLIGLVKNRNANITANQNVFGFSAITTIPVFTIVGILLELRQKKEKY